MTRLPLLHATELVLVAAGALAHVHVASARSRSARELWFNGLLLVWTLCWSSWYALTFISLNLETIAIGRVAVLSTCLDVAKGALISVQAAFLLHGVARWTAPVRVPWFSWYLVPLGFVATGLGPLVAHPAANFLRNVEDLVLVFLLADALQTAVAAHLLRRGRSRLSPVARKVSIPLETALAWSVPLLLLSALAKRAQGGYTAARYDWVLLFDLAHLLPPAALLLASHRTRSVAFDVSRATLVRIEAFAPPFLLYMVHKLLRPGAPLDRILTFVVASTGFLLLLGPLPRVAASAASRALDLGMQREARALAALDDRLRGRRAPRDPASFAARCVGRILSCRARVVHSGDPSAALLAAAAGNARVATLGRSRTREELHAWDELGARILLAVRLADGSAPQCIALGPSRATLRPRPLVLAALSGAAGSLQACLDARAELHSRLEAERRLQEGERLAMLGLLSASAAHEIRNPLSSIRNVAHAAIRDAAEGSTIRADLGVIASEVDRLDATVRRMLHFARDRSACEDASTTLRATCGLLDQESRSRGIRLGLALPDGPVPMPMSENDLKATVFNLVLNALQNTPKGGLVDVRLAAAGPVLEVENDGEIPDDFRPQLFRPLASREGTGLGLYICRRRAEESGGSLSHHPRPGRTLFRLSWSSP